MSLIRTVIFIVLFIRAPLGIPNSLYKLVQIRMLAQYSFFCYNSLYSVAVLFTCCSYLCKTL